MLERVQVDLDYAKRGAAPVPRRVHPYGLVAKGGVWYLLAGTASGRRTFRVSRVRAVRRREEPVALPESFDLISVTLSGKVQPLLNNAHKQWMARPMASPDGKHLAFQAQTWDSNVWMIANF